MNRNRLIIAVIVVLILLVGGYFVFFAGKSSNQNTTSSIVEQTIPTISADSIGLTLKPGSDKQRVIMSLTKVDGINSLDYELSYTAKGNIPRGILGHVDVKNNQPVSTTIYLGTCSDVCHPDSDVSNIKIVVKVNKSDGKVYQAQASTSF